jgi:hypothetical protein
MTESQDARILFWFQKVKQLEKENEALKQKIKELEKPTKPHLSMCERCGEDKDTVILCWGKDDEVYLCCGDCYSR